MKKRWISFLLGTAGFLSVSAQSYQEYYQRGLEMVEADSLSQAEYFFKEALRVEPANVRNTMIFSSLGIVQQRMGKYEEAIESFTLSLNIYPHYIPVLLNRASLYLELGELNRAILDYNEVLAQDTDHVEALLMRAYIYMSRIQYQESRADYDHLLKIDPQNYAGRLGLVTLGQRMGNQKESLELLNDLILEFPTESELYIARANLQFDMQHADVAILDLEEAIRLNPTDPTSYYVRGEIYLSMKKTALARQNFEKAISLGFPVSELREQLKRVK